MSTVVRLLLLMLLGCLLSDKEAGAAAGCTADSRQILPADSSGNLPAIPPANEALEEEGWKLEGQDFAAMIVDQHTPLATRSASEHAGVYRPDSRSNRSLLTAYGRLRI